MDGSWPGVFYTNQPAELMGNGSWPLPSPPLLQQQQWCEPPVERGSCGAEEDTLMARSTPNVCGDVFLSAEDENGNDNEEEARTHPAVYVCPAAADAARNSSRELLQLLMMRGSATQLPLAVQQQQQQLSAPLAITWHTTPSPSSGPSSFVPLPHKKRMREVAGFVDATLDDGAGAVAKRWRADDHEVMVVSREAEQQQQQQKPFVLCLLPLVDRKRRREEVVEPVAATEALVDAPSFEQQRRRRL
ncbi:hypothetical protein DQ04_06431060 [Trypanosoma grayi]|uniref:hypothetical protein n=1 Tax=Trypanosoma grayi TaxID=71804 RepID=UPI0004F48DD1|nr:hypothetical protein DQ04_06431060 [Trypanosoma grayi]KEG08802.1 hypothetical protein DQ04_06431060 [Trypanosoma grayi]